MSASKESKLLLTPDAAAEAQPLRRTGPVEDPVVAASDHVDELVIRYPGHVFSSGRRPWSS